MTSSERIQYLFNRFVNKTTTLEETAELFALIREPEHEQAIHAFMEQHYAELPADQPMPAWDWDYMFAVAVAGDRNEAPAAVVHRVHFLRRGWLRYAAAIIVIMGVASWLWWSNQSPAKQVIPQDTVAVPPEVAPGTTGAVLTLASGKQIILDTLDKGIVAKENGTEIELKEGTVSYNAAKYQAVGMNTMTTPRGRQFQVLLPDGTKVWLNAASSLTYPTAFTGNNRTVALTGEAYFEVARNKAKPFKVKLNEQTEVEVLGTHFNVNAYQEEGKIKATLLEGSVRVKALKHTQVLAPGQQAQIMEGKNEIKIARNVNVEYVMAWKNGLFNFDGASLKEVMNQLARWYNIEVVYPNGVPDMYFGGEMSRNLNLSEVLMGLQDARVQFRIEDNKKLIVTQ